MLNQRSIILAGLTYYAVNILIGLVVQTDVEPLRTIGGIMFAATIALFFSPLGVITGWFSFVIVVLIIVSAIIQKKLLNLKYSRITLACIAFLLETLGLKGMSTYLVI